MCISNNLGNSGWASEDNLGYNSDLGGPRQLSTQLGLGLDNLSTRLNSPKLHPYLVMGNLRDPPWPQARSLGSGELAATPKWSSKLHCPPTRGWLHFD